MKNPHKWTKKPENPLLFWSWRILFIFGGTILFYIGILLTYNIESEIYAMLIFCGLIYLFLKILMQFEQWIVDKHSKRMRGE